MRFFLASISRSSEANSAATSSFSLIAAARADRAAVNAASTPIRKGRQRGIPRGDGRIQRQSRVPNAFVSESAVIRGLVGDPRAPFRPPLKTVCRRFRNPAIGSAPRFLRSAASVSSAVSPSAARHAAARSDASRSASAAPSSPASWARSDSNSASFALMLESSSRASAIFVSSPARSVTPAATRCGSTSRLQRSSRFLGFLLRFPTAASDMHRCDVTDTDFDLRAGFDIDRLAVRGRHRPPCHPFELAGQRATFGVTVTTRPTSSAPRAAASSLASCRIGPSAPGVGTVIAARCPTSPARSPDAVSRRPLRSDSLSTAA